MTRCAPEGRDGGGVAGCLKLGHKMQIPRIRLNDFDYLKRNSNNSNKSNNKQKRGEKDREEAKGKNRRGREEEREV